MKKNLFKSLLLLVVLAAFSADNTKAFANDGSPTKKIKRTLARVAEKILHLPTREIHYQYNESGTETELTSIFKYDYNAQGDVIFSVELSANADTLSKSISKYDFIDGREISSINYVRDFDSDALVPESRDTFFYDNQNKPLRYLNQVYVLDTQEWMNESKVEFSYSTSALIFPDSYVIYNWVNNQWVKSSEASNVTWVDFVDFGFTSGTFIVYKNEFDDYTYRTTYSTDESGVQVGITALLVGDEWFNLTKVTTIKDVSGNLVETNQRLNGENLSRHTSLVDEKGADAGYINETWFEDQWVVTEYYKYINTYNNNDEMIKSEREAFNLNGDGETINTLISYSNFVQVTTGIKGTSTTDISTSHFTYPNPSIDVLNIENPSHETLQISIFNMQNNLVLSETIDAGKGSISIIDFPSGIYLLKSTTLSGKIYTEKIVKE